MAQGPQLLIRADGGPVIGLGHLMRCLALAQAWNVSGGAVCLASAELNHAVSERLAAEGVRTEAIAAPAGSLEDARMTASMAGRLGCRWVTVDGYRFNRDYLASLQATGVKVLLVDDNGQTDCPADVVLNHNIHATPELYPGARGKLLLGCGFALIRREFLGHTRAPHGAPHLLVTMGGSDPGNVTARVVEALAGGEFAAVTATVVIGSANPHGNDISRAAAKSRGKIAVATSVSMPEVMAKSDLAISSAGVTCLELACVGVPAILLVIADNQAPAAAAWERAGTAVNLGWHEDVTGREIQDALRRMLDSPQLRQTMAAKARALVDGRGAARVIQAMKVLQPATASAMEG